MNFSVIVGYMWRNNYKFQYFIFFGVFVRCDTSYEFISKAINKRTQVEWRKQKKRRNRRCITSRYDGNFAIIIFSYIHEFLISRKKSHQYDLLIFNMHCILITSAEQDELESRYIQATFTLTIWVVPTTNSFLSCKRLILSSAATMHK